ncbi:hypothetical protein KR018_006785, partial [Drosophila ironensis]
FAMSQLRFDSNVRWYRGMSGVQTESCDALLHALRDDMEQGSTYRVRNCMAGLGLSPMVKSSTIRTIMSISQGSDLAFLWFLWESDYKQAYRLDDSDPKQYTVNEQLLLSAIAHLDMPATLRALDSLLPPASHSLKRKPKCQTTTCKSSFEIKKAPRRKTYGMPYFERQVLPRPFNPKDICRPLVARLRFPEYERYADPTQEIPNEKTRWFANYQLCPAKRVIKKLLSDELKRLIVEPHERTQPSDNEILCETHQYLREANALQQEKKVHQVLQDCLAQLDIPGAELKTRRMRIAQQMERDIECAAERIRGQSKRFLRQLKCLRTVGGFCRLCDVQVSQPGRQEETDKKSNLCKLMGLGNDPLAKPHLFADERDDLLKVLLLHREKGCCVAECRFIEARALDEIKKEPKISLKKKKMAKFPLPPPLPPLPPPKPEKKLADLIPVCSRTLPCLRRRHKPPEVEEFTCRKLGELQLDYGKIFDIPGVPVEHMPWEDNFVDMEDKQPLIHRLFIEALNEGKSEEAQEVQRDMELPPIQRAAAGCAIDIFRTSVQEVVMGQRSVMPIASPEIFLIDPNNSQQIEDLLKKALEVLQCNPHYVLASFPNAHKLPMLLDWVANRYGKTFSREEMQALIKSTYHIYEHVYQREERKERRALKLVKGMQRLEGHGRISYFAIREFKGKAKGMKAIYHSKLNDLALEQSRLTWLALRGYTYLGGRIKDTFFAYMPARMQDLKRNHIWRSTEFRDMVEARKFTGVPQA